MLQIFRRHNYLLHELQIQASRKEVFMISVKKMVVSSHITSGLKILDTIYSKLGIFSDLFYNHSLIQEKMSVESPWLWKRVKTFGVFLCTFSFQIILLICLQCPGLPSKNGPGVEFTFLSHQQTFFQTCKVTPTITREECCPGWWAEEYWSEGIHIFLAGVVT